MVWSVVVQEIISTQLHPPGAEHPARSRWLVGRGTVLAESSPVAPIQAVGGGSEGSFPHALLQVIQAAAGFLSHSA